MHEAYRSESGSVDFALPPIGVATPKGIAWTDAYEIPLELQIRLVENPSKSGDALHWLDLPQTSVATAFALLPAEARYGIICGNNPLNANDPYGYSGMSVFLGTSSAVLNTAGLITLNPWVKAAGLTVSGLTILNAGYEWKTGTMTSTEAGLAITQELVSDTVGFLPASAAQVGAGVILRGLGIVSTAVDFAQTASAPAQSANGMTSNSGFSMYRSSYQYNQYLDDPAANVAPLYNQLYSNTVSASTGASLPWGDRALHHREQPGTVPGHYGRQ